MSDVRTVVVVGAGMAGLRTAEGLRDQGFDGRVVLLSEEPHAPYDRPPLSKGFLKGEVEHAALVFVEEAVLADKQIELVRSSAVSLDPSSRQVRTGDDVVTYDRAVIATGARARGVPGIAADCQPLVLRTLDDAVDLRQRLSRSRDVVVIGGGLIGCELAATSRSLGLDVTLVEAGPTLMSRSLGNDLGQLSEALHRDQGVEVVTGVSATSIVPPTDASARWSVTLSSGTVLESDLVVAGIGASPVVEWLSGSGLAVSDGVVCDETLTTSDPHVMAAGDVARFLTPDGSVRTEQWLSALDQARHVAANILLPHGERSAFTPSDYFWTDQYGLMIQGAGTHAGAVLETTSGDAGSHTYLVRAVRDGEVVGVYASGFAREFGRLRRTLASPAT